MPKPLFRFTIGNTTDQGVEILEESVFRTMRALGEETFDWMICTNGLKAHQQSRIRNIVQGRPVTIHEQKWSDCPIDDEAWSPIRPDGSIEPDGALCGGTMWKVCPARMRIDAHEIVMDNDMILMKKLPQIDQFLKSDRTLILEEPVRFYGRYEKLIPFEDRINSGLMGFPPNYDFGREIRKVWLEHGRLHRITQGDEQGLLMYVLQQRPNIRIKKEEVRELFPNDDAGPTIDDPDTLAVHFVVSNRIALSRPWLFYKDRYKSAIPFV